LATEDEGSLQWSLSSMRALKEWHVLLGCGWRRRSPYVDGRR